MTTDQPTTQGSSDGRHGMGGRWWALPAATFLVGVVLGAGVLWASSGTDSGLRAGGPSSSTSKSSSPSVVTLTATVAPSATLSVPRTCLKVADDSKAVTDIVTQMVSAARDLDASKLSDLLRQLQTAQTTLGEDAATCKEADANVPSLTTTTQ